MTLRWTIPTFWCSLALTVANCASTPSTTVLTMRHSTSKHHVLPRSRVLPQCDPHKQNIVEWDADFHDLWHRMFENMTVWEVHRFIDIITKSGDRWTRRDIRLLQERLMANRPLLPNKCNLCDRPLLKDNCGKCKICGEMRWTKRRRTSLLPYCSAFGRSVCTVSSYSATYRGSQCTGECANRANSRASTARSDDTPTETRTATLFTRTRKPAPSAVGKQHGNLRNIGRATRIA